MTTRNKYGKIYSSHELHKIIPVKGKSLPHSVTLTRIERKDDEQKDWGIQEQEDQAHEQAASGMTRFVHSITACSSPSPKWFITTMQATTTTIITIEMAAPRWGL